MTQNIDYSKTIFLPKTAFPMKANLPQREPETLQKWLDEDLSGQINTATKKQGKTFILHDGPPYANGNMHIGHCLNYILKDVICRSKRMTGHYVPFVNGSDCHGLPIEWKIEEKYRKKKLDKDDVPVLEFRQECREFAAHWVAEQRKDLIRLGIGVKEKTSYTTMTNAAEAAIASEISKFLMNGGLYKGYKSVMWSPVEKTALADAEVEYEDHTSHTVWVKFPITSTNIKEAQGASIVIWTTTPWTLPANRAVAYGADIDYVVVDIGEKIIVAQALLEEVLTQAEISDSKILHHFKGHELTGTICHHPFHGSGYDFDIPALAGDFVTTEQGTGIVHIAPGHGEDDFTLGTQNNIEVAVPVGDDGTYYKDTPLFAGLHVYKAHEQVIEELKKHGRLLAQGTLVHSYPHSWRSKAPVIFRATPQWFISMETNDLRKNALAAIKKTAWFPKAGENRITAMVTQRPDWCISRQRTWGVPITVFVHKKTGEPLRDQKVCDRIVKIFEAEGSDAWFTKSDAQLLGPDHEASLYEKVTDIVDVWFESGSTHAFVLEAREDLSSPADLYLEGSDQHRGWFQSSLLESVGTRDRAPFKAVLTHGFVQDKNGRKMSKSLGNVVAPEKIMKEHGADILRLWVVGSDYTDDLRIGNEILQSHKDIYRRLRNTLRYIIGNLTNLSKEELVEDIAQMPELEQWVLHRLTELDHTMRNGLNNYDFQTAYTELHNFCASDLSSFYFDVRKDTLYCDRPDSMKRRAARTVLHHLYQSLVRWLAPVICFTAEEAWSYRPFAEGPHSVHLTQYAEIPTIWANTALDEKWQKIRRLRRVVNGALEKERAAKTIGSSLEAAPIVYASAEYVAALKDQNLAEICITSQAILEEKAPPPEAFTLEDITDVGVVFKKAEGQKCERSWKILPDVGANPEYPTLSPRDADAVAYFLENAPPEHLQIAVGT